ncbi:hypothetical protein JYK22_29995, partial [Nonomuraea sp. RK-328]|nr:hypothetical protein [Nonomuraea sp. RK-328]
VNDMTKDMTRRGADLDALTRALARVEPGAPGADPSGAGARTLLASIVASPATEDPLAGVPTSGSPVSPLRRRGLGRLAAGLAVAAALAGGIVVGPSLLGKGGGATPSYAVTKDDHGVVTIQVRDFSDADGLRRRLRELGVPAIVDYVPEGKMCKEPRAEHVDDIPEGLYSLPADIPGERHGWQMRIDTRLFRPGETFVWMITRNAGGGSSTHTILMKDPVGPCELVPAPKQKEEKAAPLATLNGRLLDGYRVDEKTVGEVLPEIRRRGLKAVFLVMEIGPGNPGGFGEGPELKTSPGDDWVVWEAEEVGKRTVRLLVTDRRYDRNPVYGGPRDAVIKD